jgi:hypothetical protein
MTKEKIMELTTKSQKDIDDLLNKCMAAEDEGTTKYPGMTYEQGVTAGIRWLMEHGQPHPLED